MSSFTDCIPYTQSYYDRRCVFAGVSPCRDHVASRICNAHLEMFGLICQAGHYVNGNNESWAEINLYMTGSSSLNIPMFQDNEGRHITNEVRNFVANVCHNIPGIKVDILAARISELMGTNPYLPNPTCERNWMDDSSSSLMVRTPFSIMKYKSRIPLLHKILFHHAMPSSNHNIVSNKSQVGIANVSLTYNASNNMCYFKMIPNTQGFTLKWTDHVNGIASPIVLAATHEVSHINRDIIVQPINNFSNMVC